MDDSEPLPRARVEIETDRLAVVPLLGVVGEEGPGRVSHEPGSLAVLVLEMVREALHGAQAPSSA